MVGAQILGQDVNLVIIKLKVINACDMLDRKLVIKMRKQRAAARRFPFQLVIDRRDRHMQKPQSPAFRVMQRKRLCQRINRRKMDKTVRNIMRRTGIMPGRKRFRPLVRAQYTVNHGV